jgi:hypothetical protein
LAQSSPDFQLSAHVWQNFSVGPSNPTFAYTIAGRTFTADTLYENAALLCAGKINPAYFELLEQQISEYWYHVEMFTSVLRKINPDVKADGTKGNVLGAGPIEYE